MNGTARPPLFLLTGPVGSGKSTVCLRLAEIAGRQGRCVGGIVTRTEGRCREVVDLASGERRLLASQGEALAGPRWGPFSFSQEALDWGNEAIARATAGPASLVILDEVGPLELIAGGGLLPALRTLLESERAALVVVRPALLGQVRAMAGMRPTQTWQVTPENRDELPARRWW